MLKVPKPTIGIIGTVISISLFFTPIPTFYKIIKEKSVGEYKPDPYLAIMMNCGLWVVYGMPFVHPDSKLIVIINGIGLVVGLVYLTLFWIYATNEGRVRIVSTKFIQPRCFVNVALSCSDTYCLFHKFSEKVHGTHQRSLAVGICHDPKSQAVTGAQTITLAWQA
ncbi:bidirectional sugar transporter SWEET5-like [Lotus japonicus]|uniref:bidirectional sugar transporter SWEET5-like n=1 Tax=Lotus japonicus TaxID=34305 RepID=UPI00258D037A|nr:bidirectional sugar transporter SWEET5-like [Lotus japonicus]